jgi:hypothetical protein
VLEDVVKQICVALFAILNSFLLFTPVQAFQPFPDTGQTKCYDNTGEIPCPSPGQPFYGQDSQYQPRFPRSYTKLGVGGVVLSDDARSVYDGGQWIMTRDNVTGLIWEVKTPSNMFDVYGWSSAQSQFIAGLNSAAFGGFSDWRLPDIKELSTLLKFENCQYYESYKWFGQYLSQCWSSTRLHSDENKIWIVDFLLGKVYYIPPNSQYPVTKVRAVRSSSPPLPNFVDNLDGTVTDTTTGLMWQMCSYGQTWSNGQCAGSPVQLNWQQALAVAEGLNWSGYSDWRLPNKNELATLIDYIPGSFKPSINILFPLDYNSPQYWSSTTYESVDHSKAGIINFSTGHAGSNDKWEALQCVQFV